MSDLPPEGRVALYYAPAEDDPLWARACAWLGRDPASGAVVAQPDVPDIAALTRDAALYGFHATLRPPMRLRDGVTFADLMDATRRVAAGIAPFALPPLAVSDLAGFLALTETEPSPALQAYADACVAGTDTLRAPPDADELARRRRAGLAPGEEANLTRWGYPYVFATWFFHMTLTCRLDAPARNAVRPVLQAWLAPALQGARRVNDIAVFIQQKPTGDFRLAERVRLTG